MQEDVWQLVFVLEAVQARGKDDLCNVQSNHGQVTHVISFFKGK